MSFFFLLSGNVPYIYIYIFDKYYSSYIIRLREKLTNNGLIMKKCWSIQAHRPPLEHQGYCAKE